MTVKNVELSSAQKIMVAPNVALRSVKTACSTMTVLAMSIREMVDWIRLGATKSVDELVEGIWSRFTPVNNDLRV